jgi:hypothetical protein
MKWRNNKKEEASLLLGITFFSFSFQCQTLSYECQRKEKRTMMCFCCGKMCFYKERRRLYNEKGVILKKEMEGEEGRGRVSGVWRGEARRLGPSCNSCRD